jgi:large subunit ribosomal protein L9
MQYGGLLMKVILNQDVETLGEQGLLLDVSDGFARNYLFPRKLAVVASAGAMKELEARKDQLRRKAEKRYQENVEKAKKIEALGILVLEAAVGEEGKLFGTITPKDLAAILTDQTGLEIDKRNIVLSAPITRIGSYDLAVRLSPKVTANITIEVTDSEEEA